MTVVKCNQKAPFSIATTPRCRGGCYSFPRIAPLFPMIRTLYCWVLSKEVSSTILKVFGMTRPGTEPRSPGPLANTLPSRPMSQYLVCKLHELWNIKKYLWSSEHWNSYQNILVKLSQELEFWGIFEDMNYLINIEYIFEIQSSPISVEIKIIMNYISCRFKKEESFF